MPKDYPPGDKPLVLRRTNEGLRILRSPGRNIGLSSKFIQKMLDSGDVEVELTLNTTEGPVRLRMVGWQRTSPDTEDPRYNWTDLRFEQAEG